MARPAPLPLRPDPAALQRRAASLVPTGAAVALLAAVSKTHPQEIVESHRHFREDRDLALQVKAATVPASMTDADWAQTFSFPAIPNFVASLGAASAMSALLQSAGAQYRFDRGTNGVTIPTLLADATAASFVGEGSPIPVRSLAIGDAALVPRALKTICVFSRESIEHSIPNLIETVRVTLADNIGLAADTALLDDTAGTAVRPGGLRFNIPATAGASANTDLHEAMIEDVRLVGAKLAPIAGNGSITIIAGPLQAMRLKLVPNFPFRVLMSSSVADGDVIGIADNALAMALDPLPRFEVSADGTLHMDTSPSAISTAGTPNTVAAAVRDLFSSDCLALKVTFNVGWGLRNSAGLCWLNGVAW